MFDHGLIAIDETIIEYSIGCSANEILGWNLDILWINFGTYNTDPLYHLAVL